MVIDWKNSNKVRLGYPKKCTRGIFLFVALLCAVPVATAQDWVYEVQPGDSLWSICHEYVARRLCFVELGDYNRLPRHNLIAPGNQIKIPYRWLNAPVQPVTVRYSRGEVSYIPAHYEFKPAWEKAGAISSTATMMASGISLQPLPEDGKLYPGDRIVTGDGSVSLRFADGSELTLMAHSDLTLLRLSSATSKPSNTRKPSATRQPSAVAHEIKLNLRRGASLHKVTHSEGETAKRQSRYQISTPAGVAAVRGTEFRVSVVDKQSPAMLSEVLAGQVQVNNDLADSSARVDAGFGVRSEPGQAVPAPRRLLPSPVLAQPMSPEVLQPFKLQWNQLPGAISYRMEFYTKGELLEVVETTENHYLIAEHDTGEFEVVLSGVDALGLRGLNETRAFTISDRIERVALEQSSVQAESGKSFSLAWNPVAMAAGYQVDVVLDEAFSSVIEQINTTEASIEYRSKTPVYMRVMAVADNGIVSEPSDTVVWQPKSDNTFWWLGGMAVLITVLLL